MNCQHLLFFHAMYWWRTGVMLKLKKDRVVLLTELRNLVTKGLERSEDKRLSRKLKIMRKEVDRWVNELTDTKKELNEVSDKPKLPCNLFS